MSLSRSSQRATCNQFGIRISFISQIYPVLHVDHSSASTAPGLERVKMHEMYCLSLATHNGRQVLSPLSFVTAQCPIVLSASLTLDTSLRLLPRAALPPLETSNQPERKVRNNGSFFPVYEQRTCRLIRPLTLPEQRKLLGPKFLSSL